MNWKVFDCVSRVTGDSILVDSSKDAMRFYCMNQVREGSLLPIVLFRNARGIASSAIKYGRDPVSVLDAWLRTYNYRIFPMLKLLGIPYLTVDYDLMTRNPSAVRDQISNYLQLPCSDMPESFITNKYHIVAGNPMRFSSSIVVKYDNSWSDRLSPSLIALADSYQERLMLKQGGRE